MGYQNHEVDVGNRKLATSRLVVWAWILTMAILVGLGVVCIRLYSEHYATPRPYAVTARSKDGGANPIWFKPDTIVYVPCPDEGESHMAPGIYSTSPSGSRPELIWAHSKDWFLPMAHDTTTGTILALNPDPEEPVLYLLDPARRRADKIREGIHGVSISPEGRMAVIVKSRGRAQNIALYDVGANSIQQLTEYSDPKSQVNRSLGIQWVWDGSRIVFEQQELGDRPLCATVISSAFMMLDVHTGELTKLSLPQGVLGFALSPVDTRIAYGLDDDGLYVTDLSTGQGSRRIADNYSRAGWKSIAWSPDGKWLAYDASDGNVWLAPTE